jgi:hypothetical protein
MGQGKSGLFSGTKGSKTFPSDTTSESVKIKLATYLLDDQHKRGADKATWFKTALGFTKENINELSKQIVFDENKAIKKEKKFYGQLYEQNISIIGLNKRIIDIKFIWIKNNDGIVRLVTAIPTKKGK